MIGILLSVVCGITLGIFFEIPFLIEYADPLSELGLCLLLFFIGVDIGFSKDVMSNLKKMSKKVLLLPFIGIIGSLIGGYVASFFPGLPAKECIAVAGGMGWYSFSAIELGQIDPYLGGVALLTNVFRELLAIVFVPLVAKKIGSYESVAMCGATAMDSVLPIINKSNPPRISIIAFYSGLVISVAVPIMLPALIRIFGWQ
ncbi:lysine exporter LysO family protein [Fusobacterium sp.]|uniref:lysine exporter LysO family protein n=1 Tax=Fusobacterium sp. TaxID=68766 RepID=UPI00396C9631